MLEMERFGRMTDEQTIDLIEAILDCRPNCKFAKQVKPPYTEKKKDVLRRIWDEIPDHYKLEAGYDEGEWE